MRVGQLDPGASMSGIGQDRAQGMEQRSLRRNPKPVFRLTVRRGRMQANEALRKTWLDKDGEHAWLEEVESEAALKWVVEQNEAAVAALGE
jgi:hypothetical protein